MRLRLYQLKVNGQPLLEVDVDTVPWLPVRPRLNRKWLRSLVAGALRRYRECSVVKA